MSGIKTGADGMRVQFDIPEIEMGEAAKLLMMRGKRLKMTIEVVEERGDSLDDPYEDLYKDEAKPKRTIEIK